MGKGEYYWDNQRNRKSQEKVVIYKYKSELNWKGEEIKNNKIKNKGFWTAHEYTESYH